ncbi:MAG: hypothetical protein ABEJ28_00695 [Salinigranum sp.]
MNLGIADTVALAATLVFAVPIGILGGQFLLDGRAFLGGVLVVVAVLMVVLQHFVTTPSDLPGALAGRAIGTVLKVPDDEDE